MLGTTLLFWGGMSGRPMIGLVLALLVEAKHWVRIRWDFDDEDCSKAWQFTSIAIALAAVLIWLDGNRYTALPGLLSWMPPLLLPMQFVQSYGMRDSLPMSTFSFLARRRRDRNARLGLIEESTEFNFGNVLFVATILAATVGSKSGSWIYLPAIVVLTGWMLLSQGRSGLFALLPVLLVSGLLAIAGQLGLQKAEEWLGRAGSSGRSSFNPNFNATLIGTQGTVVQSPDIVWRLRPAEKTAPPRLLRTATFNSFLRTNWTNHYIESVDFKELDSRLIDDEAYLLLQPVEVSDHLTRLPRFTLRGAAEEETPLPLPGDTAGLAKFDLDGIERNTFGTVRVYPKHSVIDGSVYWHGGTNPEFPPLGPEDLHVPVREKEAITAIVEELGLKDAVDLADRLAILRTWFHKEFTYSRNLTIRYQLSRDLMPSAITRFLSKVREGHCEYFATSAALILREAGIPTRYAVGYAVIERDPRRGEFVIRGTHGHAWCRVWDEGTKQWIDFDPTPPACFSDVPAGLGWVQAFNDNLKRLREDFFIWRSQPNNRLAVTLTMIGIALGLAAFITKRLWRSKRRLEAAPRIGEYEGPTIHTPLHDLEHKARKILGRRPPGLPFAEWLRLLRPSLTNAPLLDEAITLHQRIRFDPAPVDANDEKRLAALASQLESGLK